jgi:phosphoglucomutase
VMVAAGFHVCFLDGFRGTPALSVAVRHLRCDCGVMITASHNPPTDNAVKVYWASGGQLLPPHDQGVIDRVMRVSDIDRVPFATALDDGWIECCQDTIDAVYQRGAVAAGFGGPRELRILYSPMHGVGASSVLPVLAAAGFRDVELYAPHATPDGDFPNVPGHVANPENPATFDDIVQQAAAEGFDVAFSTDPDADRLGCAAPVAPGGEWRALTGNQIGALLTDYVLDARRRAGTLTPDHFVATTMVTTPLVRLIAESHGVRVRDDLPVGFKWIAAAIDEWGADRFVLGVEESHGYLAGHHARDKDAAVAALLLAELAAHEKVAGRTLHQALAALHARHGVHAERTISRTMPGAEGMARMTDLLRRFRDNPPRSLAGLAVTRVRDYAHQVAIAADGTKQPFSGPRCDLLFLDLAGDGNRVAIRPSGTEPKVKLYLFAYEPPADCEHSQEARRLLDRRLDRMVHELEVLVDQR